MDVRFCEGRNHRREAQLRAADSAMYDFARSSEARLRRLVFSLDKRLTWMSPCRPSGMYRHRFEISELKGMRGTCAVEWMLVEAPCSGQNTRNSYKALIPFTRAWCLGSTR